MLSKLISKAAGITPYKGKYPNLKDPENFVQLYELPVNPFYPTLAALLIETTENLPITRDGFLSELYKLLQMDTLITTSIKNRLQQLDWHYTI